MSQSSFVMFDEEYREISAVVEKLLKETNAKCVYLVDKDGQLISSTGETHNIDATSLASLTAGNIAATGGLVRLRVKKASEELGKSIQKLLARMEEGSDKESLLKEITDDDIERLFH